MAEKNICLLFGIFPPPLIQTINNNSKGVIQNAADVLQKSFLEGLRYHYSSIVLVNLPFLSSYPFFYKKMKCPSCEGKYKTNYGDIPLQSLSYLNVPIVKTLQKQFCAYINLKKASEPYDVIVVYSLHTPLLAAAVKYKKRINRKTRIIVIVPDLPEFMNSRLGIVKSFLKKLDTNRLHHLLKDVDGYVLLAEQMTERLPVESRPFVVIEGILNRSAEHMDKCAEKQKRILYGGTLDRRYGVMNLIKAFVLTNNQDYTLTICGAGDSQAEVKEYASKYKNIEYLGQIERNKLLQIQQSSSLLVNPRTAEGVFTRYSFPSKNIEYLGSGVPTLLYRLPAIPDDYYNYCFSLDNSSIEALSIKLAEIMSMNPEVLKTIGEKAKMFVEAEKNPVKQCQKLKSLIEHL